MAATVDLGQQLQVENVSHLPPRAPSCSGRPWSGCFQNRGRLFSTLKQQSANDTDGTQTTGNSPSPIHIAPTPPSPENSGDNVKSSLKHRRVQSAKARLERFPTNGVHSDNATVACPGSDLAVFDVNMNLNIDRKPFRRHSKAHTKDNKPFPHEVLADRSASRPSSAKTGKNVEWIPAPCLAEPQSEEMQTEAGDTLKPSVYGYRLKRQVFGSNPNIFTAGLQSSHPSTMFRLDETGAPASRQEQKLKSDQTNGDHSLRNIPWHMEPLRPWLTQMVPQEVIGVDPSTCLVFLPLNQTFDDLPVVPLQ
ncbi:uncharacterized protein LOC143291835 [Babylonia areolata]|uniref:uncharacterized protein LOC143291835 n=1 Tax=Babylonia areolata TaxID=304850 RepID=UPI003FCFA69F